MTFVATVAVSAVPLNLDAVKELLLGLYLKSEFVSIPWAPEAPSTKVRNVDSLEKLFVAAVTFVATVAVSAVPWNRDAVKELLLGLYLKLESVSMAWVPEAPSINVI